MVSIKNSLVLIQKFENLNVLVRKWFRSKMVSIKNNLVLIQKFEKAFDLKHFT